MQRIELRQVEAPEAIEKINSNGLVQWGEDNLRPQFLVSLIEDNPIHGGILNQKVTFISGGGIRVEGDSGESLTNTDESPYSLEEVIVDTVTVDTEYFNGYAVLFKKNIYGRWFAMPVDFELVRATEDGIWYEISDDWSKTNQSAESTNWRRVKCIHSREETDIEVLLYVIAKPKQRTFGEGKQKKLSLSYYPVPTYSGGMLSIMAGCEFDWFTLSEIVHGYQGGTLINLANGVPDSIEEENRVVNRIQEDATNKKKKGGIAITFSDGKEREPRVSQLTGNDLAGRYIESGKQVARQIMIAHQVISPALFSVLSETLFGSEKELEVAYNLFKATYVRKRQKFITGPIEWALNMLNGTSISITFNDYVLPGTGTGATQTEMSSDKIDPVLRAFTVAGVPRSGIEILRSESFNYATSDEEFISTYSSFAVNLTKDQEVIVQMIKDGKSYAEVSRALGKGGIWLSNQLVRLGQLGVLDGWKVVDSDIEAPQYKVLYSYEVKPGLGETLISTSREFCVEMVKLDKLYTRAEIDLISGAVDRDVWRYRGGWYTNPNTGRTTDSCRHEWKQNIVKA